MSRNTVLKVQTNSAICPVDERQVACVKDIEGESFKAKIYMLSNGQQTVSPDISWMGAICEIATARFLTIGNNGENLREQVLQELQNTSLIAALVTTMAAPSVLSIDNDIWVRDSWELGIYQALMNAGTSTLLGSVFLSVFYLLCVNECTTNLELRRFLDRMGTRIEFPIILFLIGALCFAGAVVVYSYNTFPFAWFAPTAFLCNAGIASVLLSKFVFVIQALYKSKSRQDGSAQVSRAEIQKAIQAYTKLLPCLECASVQGLRQFMAKEINCYEFFPMTDRKIRTEYESFMKSILVDEYESPIDASDEENASNE